MIQSAKNVLWQGDEAFSGSIRKGMNLELVVKVLEKYIQMLFSGQSIECLDLSSFGITCKEDEDLLCKVLFTLLTNQNLLSDKVSNALKALNSTTTVTTTNITDERVKASSTSTVAKYLVEAIKGTVGRVTYDSTADVVKITGLVPIGTRATINPKRISDFDADGKGKAGTDLEGWQIRNGKNGTDVAFGRFPRYADSVDTVGKKDGSNSVIIDKANIKGFTLTVTGGIGHGGPTAMIVETPYAYVYKHFGAGSGRDVCVPDPNIISGYRHSKPINLSHNHNFDLSVTHDNPTPTAISTVPEHITELPIEFIGI